MKMSFQIQLCNKIFNIYTEKNPDQNFNRSLVEIHAQYEQVVSTKVRSKMILNELRSIFKSRIVAFFDRATFYF